MTDYETVTVRGDNLMVDLILWRRFKRVVPGLLERTLAANEGLADLGPILPVGTVFKIPIEAPDVVTPRRPAVRLWD
ncbi:phage tail protein [Labrys sp. WJW]|uniref:tail protein X n=1 Tax=Labrys sp. WJW TaxID=1737983 RepID=UPI00082B394B|nr:tail protein X [Labrys sp. WJW]OCC05099.1 phage tail protein [Labrys sp. WJW]